MNMLQSIGTCFRKYAQFSGRASRSEFWWFLLFQFAGDTLFEYFDIQVFSIFGTNGEIDNLLEGVMSFLGLSNGLFGTVFGVFVLIPGLAVTSRRLHDIDMSGWWQLVPYVALLSIFLFDDYAQTQTLFLLWFGVILVILGGFIVLWAKKGQSFTNNYGRPTDYDDTLSAFD